MTNVSPQTLGEVSDLANLPKAIIVCSVLSIEKTYSGKSIHHIFIVCFLSVYTILVRWTLFRKISKKVFGQVHISEAMLIRKNLNTLR